MHPFVFLIRISWRLPAASLQTAIPCHYLQNGPALGLDSSAGPVEIVASAVCLPGSLVRRDGCLRGFGCLRRFRRNFAFAEIAFLLFVLLVRPAVHVLDSFHPRLIRLSIL